MFLRRAGTGIPAVPRSPFLGTLAAPPGFCARYPDPTVPL